MAAETAVPDYDAIRARILADLRAIPPADLDAALRAITAFTPEQRQAFIDIVARVQSHE